MTNWKNLLGKLQPEMWIGYASGNVAQKDIAKSLSYSEVASDFRSLVRTHGDNKARQLTRQALRRRALIN